MNGQHQNFQLVQNHTKYILNPSNRPKPPKFTSSAEYSLTCLIEIGNVNLPETSGVLTISLVMARQLRHTPAQATTLFLRGQEVSDASILIRTSLRSSWGILAQQLWTRPSVGSGAVPSCTTRRERDLISWMMLLRDMNWPDFWWKSRRRWKKWSNKERKIGDSRCQRGH